MTVGDDFFNPSSILVSPGATVTWTWTGSDLHNVVFASASVQSLEVLQSSGQYETAMPTTPGTYGYQCTNHAGMNGSVRVQ